MMMNHKRQNMFNQFRAQFGGLAWAGEGPGNPFWMSERRGHKHGHGGPFGGGWGEKPRTRRGNVKFILLELLSKRPQHGYELIQAQETRRGGFRRLSPGSVYPTLQMLEEGGYLTSEEVDDKRVYTITESGRQFLSDRDQRSHSGNPDDSFEESNPAGLVELRHTLTELNDAVRLIARSGDLEQTKQVKDLLAEVKREIYKLLAEQ